MQVPNSWRPTRVVACCVIFATCAGSLSASDWPRYRGEQFDGISREADWLGEWKDGDPQRLWQAEVGIGFSSLTVSGGRVFTLGSDGKKEGGQDIVRCLDASTGREIWQFGYPQDLDPKYYEGGPGSTPTVHGDHVFVVGRHGKVVCLKAEDGSVVWQRDLAGDPGIEIPEWGLNGSVHIEDGLAILNAGSHGMALDAKTGETRWASGKTVAGYATPVPFEQNGKRLLAIFGAEHVFAVNPKTGEEAWRLPWKTRYDVNASDPIIHQSVLFISSGYGTGASAYDLTETPPKTLWVNKTIRAQMASCIAINGHVYGIDGQGGDRNAHLKCVDIRTGEVRWEAPAAETGNLAAVGDTLLWLTGTGEIVLAAADPTSYRELRRSQISGGKHWSVPVLANGRLYVRNAAGTLVCVATRPADDVR